MQKEIVKNPWEISYGDLPDVTERTQQAHHRDFQVHNAPSEKRIAPSKVCSAGTSRGIIYHKEHLIFFKRIMANLNNPELFFQ
ncbi:hypothetical protein ABEB36_006210 [Hypothenemus hampei]|uniref:Uncharacterized protein n=1 Tax=Hypothenemus hampei TaxID=57062 RepID=A0ABD1EQ57_HYPHA